MGRADLPSGTVTFLSTDIEGSTKLLHELGAADYARVLAEHHRIVAEACAAEGGVVVGTEGDAFFVAFSSVPGAVRRSGPTYSTPVIVVENGERWLVAPYGEVSWVRNVRVAGGGL